MAKCPALPFEPTLRIGNSHVYGEGFLLYAGVFVDELDGDALKLPSSDQGCSAWPAPQQVRAARNGCGRQLIFERGLWGDEFKLVGNGGINSAKV